MQSGFNTNIRHRGVLFHVQTEDGGAARPRVTTHLFLGGDILATERLDYADRLDAPDLGSEVRGRMQVQHKAMLRALCSGAHDAVVVARAGAAIFASDSAQPSGPADAAAVEDTGERPERAVVSPLSDPPTRWAGPESTADLGGPAATVAADDDGERPLVDLMLEYLVERARARDPRAS